MNKKFISESQALFSRLYKQQSDKIRKVPDTIFENLEYFDENEMYCKFVESKYYDKVISENSTYNKNNLIISFLMEEFSNVFYSVKHFSFFFCSTY